ncbi:hypothetical protein M1B34_31880 [Pseudomonas sp. MAFF 302030]|uniref:Uncharacterized protein n=1 Tax=Pseudomonas morbosilactucae TaxID=2938197 RepID=A0A9X1Z1C3_9PSED|nr:hypothetical protein [Pseudomonas morbosilactucae]MCK9802138.1 hypothetical protein [Pseudomonas morbosilactucae]
MSEVKRFRADHRHVVETEFDDAQFVGVADFDRITAERDVALEREAALQEDLEVLRDDLIVFKSAVSAIGEASKKLVFCARTTGGTAGPDQGLMDACAAVEGVITLGGIARATNEFEQLTSVRDALQQLLNVADDRADKNAAIAVELAAKECALGKQVIELEQRHRAEFEAGQAAERRVEVLEGLLREAVGQVRGVVGNCDDELADRIEAVVGQGIVPKQHNAKIMKHSCKHCDGRGWIDNLRPVGVKARDCPYCKPAAPRAPN